MTASMNILPLMDRPRGSENNPSPASRLSLGVRSTAALKIDVVYSRQDFDALEIDWNDLYCRAGARSNIFQSFNWNWHWCNHYLNSPENIDNKTTLAIVTIRKNGQLVMLWPTAIVPCAGLKQLTWMGDPVSQYGDVLVDDTADQQVLLEASWAFIKQNLEIDLLLLRKVRDDGIVAPILKAAKAVVIVKDEAVSHNLAVDGDFATYSKRFKPRAIRNRRRQFRRLEELGTVKYSEYTEGSNAHDIALDAIAMKRKWLEQKGLVSRAYADTRFDAFFAAVAKGKDHPSGCIVSVLTCADKIAAVEIGLNDSTARYMHIIVYNMEFEKFGAGARHMQSSIQSAFGAGLKTFDLLAPNTRYKTEWADDIIPVLDYAIGLNTIGNGYVQLYLKTLRQGAKNAFEKLPSVLKRFITTRK